MIYNEAVFSILDDVEDLAHKIKQSDIYHAYLKTKSTMEEDVEATNKYQAFIRKKEKYDEVMRFGNYHPDYFNTMIETRKLKREYEMHPSVVAFRQHETKLQDLIDEVLVILSKAISDHIKVEAGNPFFRTDVGGGCSTGGSCQCSS
ncbi:YlbF family regulator [Staphylococcus massiliensis]|nr:YlbF family regulator [Staphylococcus massiliensis]MCG3400506.1 YlbF family regulator [Staphylococcus massiliensis]